MFLQRVCVAGPLLAFLLDAMHFARVYFSPKDRPSQVEAADLYFARGRPLLVRTWKRENGRRVPQDVVELDPAQLRRASANGTIYRYEGEIRP